MIRTLLRAFMIGVALAALAACALPPSVRFTPSSQRTVPAKPADCFIEVVMTVPQRPYDEIGYFNLTGGRAVGDAESFRTTVTPEACGVGADAVIANLNGVGIFTGAVAIAWRTDDDDDDAPPPAAAAGASATQP